jgi:DNA primase
MLKKSIRSQIRQKQSRIGRRKKWKEEEIDMVSIYEQVSQDRVKRTPGGFISTCPFPDHSDSTPSFVMYPDTQSYYCFGCNKSGKASWFKREMERIYGI